MTSFLKAAACLAMTALFPLGCQSESEPAASVPASPPVISGTDGHDQAGDAHADHGDSDVAAEMAKLSPEDRKEAEVQKFCVISDGSRLGSMGPPIKLDINGESVFVCCSGCKSAALKNPEKTLATVAKLKAKNSSDVK